jgi:RNA polymerase sigma-70 factor, ECF subfamily
VVESGQQSDAPRAVQSSAPSPRKKVTVSLTPAQAESLRALWQEHSAALHAMLTGWCGNAQNASDMLQELFRRLAESPSVLVRMKNTGAFLAVSARRIAVDFARRSATRTSYQTAAGAEVPVVENPGPTDENLRAAIKGALDGLPAEQRVVFEHKILKGRTLEEIARLESISLNTAASRLRYALDKIRGQLRPYYDDLNRQQFKNMKNDLNQDLSENKRIITPLEPKRVPSVVPGLEGLAALSADSGVSDAPTPEVAECYALPTVEAPAPEFVEPQIHIDPFFVPPPTGGIDPIPETCWEETAPEIVDGGNGELPELVICEMFPPDGQIPTEWLKPLELPEEFLVTIFEGEGETGVVDGHADSIEGAGDETYASWTHLAPPFGLENGFEICVLPVPEEFVAEVDPREYLVRYDAFLAENPDWGALDPDVMEAQVITASKYFGELEFGTPSKAAAFDNWYATHLLGGDSSEGETQDGSAESDGSAPFEPKELLPRYDAFLRENPDWGALDPDMMEIQVVTQSSVFGELEFGTPSKAAAFDNWYVNVYSQDAAGGGTVVTGGEVVLSGGVAVDQADGNTLTLSNGSKVVLEGGQVVSGENVYAYNPEFGSGSLPGPEAQLGAAELPTEIAITGDAVVEAGSPFGSVAVGLAPTPNQALIVEFGVLSPSEPLQASQMQAASHASGDLPQSVVASSGGSAGTSGADAALSAALDDATLDNALPHVAASARESELASNAGIKIDAPTAAAGAVAVGTVVHGGAAAPALRRPLPTL